MGLANPTGALIHQVPCYLLASCQSVCAGFTLFAYFLSHSTSCHTWHLLDMKFFFWQLQWKFGISMCLPFFSFNRTTVLLTTHHDLYVRKKREEKEEVRRQQNTLCINQGLVR